MPEAAAGTPRLGDRCDVVVVAERADAGPAHLEEPEAEVSRTHPAGSNNLLQRAGVREEALDCPPPQKLAELRQCGAAAGPGRTVRSRAHLINAGRRDAGDPYQKAVADGKCRGIGSNRQEVAVPARRFRRFRRNGLADKWTVDAGRGREAGRSDIADSGRDDLLGRGGDKWCESPNGDPKGEGASPNGDSEGERSLGDGDPEPPHPLGRYWLAQMMRAIHSMSAGAKVRFL